MKRIVPGSFFFFFAVATSGCGMMMPGAMGQGGQPGGGGRQASAQPGVVIPNESKEMIRKGEIDGYARADEANDEALDKMEKDALTAVRVTLGKEGWAQGMPLPTPAADTVAFVKKSKVKMKLAPVETGNGGANDFLQLTDEATEKLQLLGKKQVDGTATAADRAQMMSYSKVAMKMSDLRMQVMRASMSAVGANSSVQNMALQQMMRVSGMVRSRKTFEMEFTPEDYALVKRGLERQRRTEAIAATSMAMLAAYQAVINGNGDPRALDVIGKGTLDAFPIKPTVTDAEAKAYVDGLVVNVGKVKERYEGMMRKTWGDAKYEKNYKAGIDAMFAQAENAQNARSVTQIAGDVNTKYKADVARCMRGETVGDGSMVSGPSCKSLRRAAQTGDTSDLLPGALAAFKENGGSGGAGLPRNAKNGVDLANAAASGDAGGALDGASKMFPGDSTIGASLQGLAALKNGDPRGAINAALSFVPVPGLKDVFGLASKLLFK